VDQIAVTDRIKAKRKSPGERALRWLRNALGDMLGETPERRYVRRWIKRMEGGARHSTLGAEVRDEAATRAGAEQWLAALKALGLKPSHLCIDYGCGSLWAGEPVIRYLQPGRFIGLDVTDRFYSAGRARLGRLLDEKSVRLRVISPRLLREMAALHPDFIYSRKVLPHVPPGAAARYLANLCGLMAEHTIVVVHCRFGEATARDAKRLWRYAFDDLRAKLPPGLTCERIEAGMLIRRG